MGQYLAIGLATKMNIDRADNEAAKWSFEELTEHMQGSLALSLDNYQLETCEDDWVWTLRPELLEVELIAFLQAIYPELYPEPDEKNESEAVLQGLKLRKPEDWLAWAQQKPHYVFQMDNYGSSDYLSAPFGQRVHVHYQHVLLSMQGKILIEEYGRHFLFFKQCIAHRFGNFALARSVRVYITG